MSVQAKLLGAVNRSGAALVAISLILLIGVSCSNETKAAPTKQEVNRDPSVFEVNQPERFPLSSVETRNLPNTLDANGSITPDVNRTIHVTARGSGQVLSIKVRLGDQVEKGQPLLQIYSADLAGAFSDYQKAVADEHLAKRALDRAQLLLSRGAIAQKDLEVAQDAEDKAKLDVENTQQHVRILGGDPSHPTSTITLRAPVAGTIIEQNVAGSEGVKTPDNSPTLFTIADLSQVWVLCDVYENDLGTVRLGDAAEIRLNAYPDRVYRGQIADISRVLDPNLRSAKVRIVLANGAGSLRPGMYAHARFTSHKLQDRLLVPATAIMQLHDQDWVFRKEGAQRFRQVAVHSLGGASTSMQQIADGAVKPGEQIVTNALEFSTAVAEQAQ